MSEEKLPKEEQEKIKFKRKHKLSFHFNDYEYQALSKYCKKYRVKNKSKFMRETVVTAILKKFDEDYPSLFEQQESSQSDTPNK
jgi:hypothetical protein